MKGNQLLRKEFTQIIKSKKILIPIIAVLFVPILYAGMFLWAFWDPYKQLDDLPVAVVNLDKGAVFDGKPIEVGKGLVDNLKDNTSFKWEFVSEKEAKKGMEGRKYYMLVRIPDDFSSNATTLLKDEPKPLNLEYIPNESLNFLSSQIGGTAIEKIKGEVASTLTKTYAEKMFDSIQDVSKGLADGAEGASKLHDGSSELHDGSSKVTDGLHTLQGKSGEMKDGVQKLADGSNKLVDGSGKVTNGLNTLNSKTGEMQIGIGKLVDGSGKVTDGLHVLNSNAGIGKLVDGSGKVTNGLNTLNSKTGEMQTGIGKLIDGSGKVTDGLNTLNSKTGEMQKGIDELHDGSEKVTGGLNKLVSKSGELKIGTTDLSNGMEALVEGQRQLEKWSQEIQKGLQDLSSNVQKSTAALEEMQSKDPAILSTVNEKIDGAGANVNQLNELTQSTARDAKNAAQDVADLQKQIESLPKEYQEQLQPFVTSAIKNTTTVQQKAAGVAGGTNKLNEEVKQLKGEINQKTGNGQSKLPNPAELQSLTVGIERLSSAQTGFVEKFQGFGVKLNNAKEGANTLKNESGHLIDAINQLADGSDKVTGGLGALSAGANQMAGGVNQLANGSSQVTGGLGTLSAGANQMAGGVNQLANGSSQVTGGLGTLSVGVSKLADGSKQVTGGLGTLSVGVNQMAGGVTQLADGSGQVTTGIGTLNGGLNKMSTGSTQLIDGVNKLADGSGKVTDGLVKVNDGSGELAEKLGEGAEKTGEVKGTDKTYDMFASPVKVKTEKMAEVPNYGTGFTPYFLSLGLFVGALLLSIVYPLRDTVGVPKSGFSWFISKFGVLLSVGIIQAVVADVILLFGLGVEVQSIPYFILFSIVTSLAFIALIQCLVTAFGDAGRFIAIITLIIQLTTSAGTFPLELIPKFLQPFNAWLPMTYSVSGLKAVVSSGDFNFMWQNVGVLMIFIVVLSLGTIASLTWMHKRQFKNIAENQSVEA
ncbi:YhgE/Pip domain-containing protein [Bacillus paranthracis]|uniref:YhgE/Pip domain-containing protein n=1 Tax=Bacillus paranthracis TaxID=2026186 RepID=UPI000200F794|nr:YhgE/Pip domain-containing protein [Bacillus paranthracis]ADY20466.1 phage infection protein [Bacillus thuringiensis serovar finitimus YBT-020]MRC73670.1 phage infection protein [Bacillus thuringiensis]OTX68841.1 phage infection protein [Bacillus thuringiensis serovar finitimus]MCR6799265.1 YhgE/Pip domain-containing protein [Bacillus paranthracis]MED0782358.1 YhgE/Pip domain-containing protein [Bacillus paranthracis]